MPAPTVIDAEALIHATGWRISRLVRRLASVVSIRLELPAIHASHWRSTDRQQAPLINVNTTATTADTFNAESHAASTAMSKPTVSASRNAKPVIAEPIAATRAG